MHRVILGLSRGDKIIVDHINHNKLDNRKANLLPATQVENQFNRTRTNNSNIYYEEDRGKWCAQIIIDTVRNRKRFDSFQECREYIDSLIERKAMATKKSMPAKKATPRKKQFTPAVQPKPPGKIYKKK